MVIRYKWTFTTEHSRKEATDSVIDSKQIVWCVLFPLLFVLILWINKLYMYVCELQKPEREFFVHATEFFFFLYATQWTEIYVFEPVSHTC